MRGFLVSIVLLAACTPMRGAIPVTSGIPDLSQRVVNQGAIGREAGNMVSIEHHIGFDHIGMNKSQHPGYIYVADGKAQALEVYRFGFAGNPIRTVQLDGAAFAVCADNVGRAYVTEQLANKVEVFSSGAVTKLGELSGVYEPEGIDCANGKVYVANHPTPGTGFGYVSVYAQGSMNAGKVIDSAPSFAPLGVAVDTKGDVFENAFGHVGRGTGGVFLEYTPGTSGSDYRLLSLLCSCADRGGIAMDGRRNVIVGDQGWLVTFLAPDFTEVRGQPAPQPGILEFFSHNRFGTFVPMNDHVGTSTVTVYPSFGSEAPYVLRAGMETPQGAAGGI